MSKLPAVKLHSNFGFGIGFEYMEQNLMINDGNSTEIEDGMTFHVRIGLSGVMPEANRAVVAIGETVLIKESGNVNLTSGIARKYGDISYSLEESEEEQPKKAPEPRK